MMTAKMKKVGDKDHEENKVTKLPFNLDDMEDEDSSSENDWDLSIICSSSCGRYPLQLLVKSWV